MRLLQTILISVFTVQSIYPQFSELSIPYYPHEVINYTLKFGVFKVGVAQTGFNFDNSCSAAFIFAEAKSTGLAKCFKNVFYRYESCMDTITGLPISDSRVLIESGYKDINTVYYNHTSRNDSSLVYSNKTDTVVVPKNINDLLSGFYQYRANLFKTGLSNQGVDSITTFFIDEVWELVIRRAGIETISTQYGDLECLKIMPVTIVGHFFNTSDAMTIWLTNDERLVPVKFTLQFRRGTLQGVMTSYQMPLFE